MPLSVSVVINTYNRGETLKKTLASFRYQTYPYFEVIVVNGPSTDRTEEILDQHRDRIKVGHCPVTNLSMSRNIGIAMAAGDIVAFIDDDAIPEALWLEGIAAGYDSEDVGAVGGFTYDHTGVDFQSKYTLCDRRGYNRKVSFDPSSTHSMPSIFEFASLLGTNATFRREYLLEIGGFDEEFIYYLDETDVCLRMMDAGYKTVISDKAYVHHKSAPSSVRNANQAMFNVYPIIRSQIYFTIKSNEGLASREQIGGWVKQVIDHFHHQADEYLALGMLSKEEYQQGFSRLQQGMMEGLIDGYTRPRQLIKREVLEKHASPFKQFPLGLPAEERLVICFITQEYPPDLNGGIARFVHQLASGLARVGHNVFVVTRCMDAPSVEFEDGVWVHRTRVSHHPKVDLPGGLNVPGEIWDRSYSLALEAMRIHNEHRRIDILESPVWDVEGIVPLLAKSGMLGDSLPYPDHFADSLMVTSLHTTYKLSIPSHKEWTSNPGYMKSFVEPVVELEKYLFQKSDMVLANTQAIIKEIESVYDMRLDPERLALVAHGIDDLVRTPRDEAAESVRGSVMPDGAVNILFVGRLEERKGIDVLLESIPGICEKYRDVRFTLVGDDTLKDERGRTYKDSFLSRNSGARWLKRVCFTGKVSEEDLNYYYSNCDIFVAPSRFESFGLIFIEAMRFGKPVIGCRAGGMVEVIEPGVTGFLAEPGDSSSLTEAMTKLIVSPDLRKTMGAEARKAFEARFTAERMADEALDAYWKAIGSKLSKKAT